MKKLLVFLLILAACYSSCQHSYDNISDFVTRETVYPGRFDTIIAQIGFERVELDLLKAGRLAPINIGKAKNTIVEYDGKTLEFNEVLSWVEIGELTQPKMYRFSVYTTDEFGNRSVPQRIDVMPFTSEDLANLVVVPPRVTAGPWAVSLAWSNISSVLLDYLYLEYSYYDKDGMLHTGMLEENPRIQMQNLQAGSEASINIRYWVVPKVENVPILDVRPLETTFSLYMPTDDEYQKGLRSREISAITYTQSMEIQLDWNRAFETMQHTSVRYTDMSNPGNPVERVIQIENDETSTILPGSKIDDPVFYVWSNYKPEGVEGVYIDSDENRIDEESLDYKNTNWSCIYTSVRPANDGFNPGGNSSLGFQNAHIDGHRGSFLSLAKPVIGNGSGNTGGSTNIREGNMSWVLDLQESLTIDYFRVLHRTENAATGLRIWGMSIYGADEYLGEKDKFTNPTVDNLDVDNTNWQPIRTNITIPVNVQETTNIQVPRSNYRFIRVVYDEWDRQNNQAVGIAEFNMGVSKNNN